ncbi:MAG: D-hexose-6-phosphate mutarotase [Methylococcaceae bacterium]|nr:D-hexose-6-phosphate mutarotase [Methylococcaceae bacterium]
MDIQQLNTEYGIADQLEFIKGKGGMPFIVIRNQSATALISLHGGQILSFKPLNEENDLLFLSSQSDYIDGKAIRGGMPVCWPWFGPDPKGLQRPNHGFVRNHCWSVARTAAADNETKVFLQFFEDYKKEKTWRQPFALTLEVTVGKSLRLKLITRNTGDKAFSITQAFHSYFLVGDINQVQVSGLEGYDYYDKLDQGTQKTQTGILTIAEEIDRIYTEVKNELIVNDPSLQRRIQIASPGNETVVVWNPWQKASEKMADLKNDSYQQFICVETGNIAFDLVQVLPDEEVCLETHFNIVRD